MNLSRKYLAVIASLLALCSCADKSAFRIKGKIDHLSEADFFVYSPDGGIDRLDTIHVLDGHFDWQTPLSEEATFVVVFPNFSEQIVFARPGDVVTMRGDANQLKQVSVEGSDDNDELTRFRMSVLESSPAERTQAMQRYVRESPESRVGIYLQRQLTLQNATSSRLRPGDALPAIALPPDSISDARDTLFLCTKSHSESPLTAGRPLVLVFWATWSGASHDANRRTRTLLTSTAANELARRPQAISISLDADLRSYNSFLKRDTVDWPARCYRMCWHTPVCEQLAIRNLPFIVLADTARNVVAAGSDWEKDIQPAIDRMLGTK